ncbi:hypothetical protein N507_1788 [Lacticaseibacillus rhamnosus DSM 14870]|uniref:Uncharacterized protein n=1 Tax=Lacticaseibacillus rhamnosus (strain LMS2-1) TaxID=525361 RepID=C2JTN5_LACRM|nr:conserved hypothetical protein [Lacticaseibacillus rhamnosus ATCC 8530]ASY48962.1 hypothetical protein N507_1788 [Lacticaseibacillus rhamnosus DSM 14870]EEN81581.1 hypothetical protein HMPREF0539_0269 [Lacticaseibacillus rhamnosus LMS2-1]
MIRKVATGQKDRNTLKPSTAIFFIFIDLRSKQPLLKHSVKATKEGGT